MPAATAIAEYELVLMIDPEIPDERRDQIAADARKRIEAGGNLKDDTAWGMRKMAFEIRQRTEADYRFFRFETEGPLLDELNHNLRIADGVLRFRIFKVDPRSPVIVPPAATAAAAGPPSRGRRDAPPADATEEPAAEAPPAEAPAAAEEPAAEAPAAAEEPAAEAPAAEPPAEPAPEAETAPASEAEAPPESPPAAADEAAPEAASEQPPAEEPAR